MKRLFALFLAMIMALSLVACGGGGAESTQEEDTATEDPVNEGNESDDVEPVYIGVVMPLSGSMADQGQQDIDGIELAAEKINEAGGIKSLGGAKIELVIEDATSDSAQVKNVAERLLSDGKVSCVLGMSSSSLTLPAVPTFEKYGVPIITGCQANALTESGYKNVFQTTVKSSEGGYAQVDFFLWLCEKNGIEAATCAVVYEDDNAGISNRDGVVERLAGTGVEVVYEEAVPLNLTDGTAIATNLKKADVDVIFCYAKTTQTELIYNAMMGINYNPLFIGGAGTAWPSFADAVTNQAEGICSVVNANYDLKGGMEDPEWVAIAEEFENRFGYFMTEHGTNNYVAMLVAAQALENAASRDPADVREALSTLTMECSNMPTGVIEFDETGYNKNAKAIIVQWQNGTCRTVWPEDCASADYIAPEG